MVLSIANRYSLILYGSVTIFITEILLSKLRRDRIKDLTYTVSMLNKSNRNFDNNTSKIRC